MAVTDPSLPWRDPSWREASDNVWQAQLRRQQGWWRQERLGCDAGPMIGRDRLVVSMLPLDVDLAPNLMTDEAVLAATTAIESLRSEKRPGLIQQERLRRNLLSSQPMCFNLFGHLSSDPKALLPWVRSVSPNAVEVTKVKLEWAPAADVIGGSAFDAFVGYRRNDGRRGFLGIEVKYAEDLAKAHPRPAPDKYRQPTIEGPWQEGAVQRLDQPTLRQFWFNQLLTQVVERRHEYDEAYGVVAACAQDTKARDVVSQVATELLQPDTLRFAALEDIVATVEGHDAWKAAFTERYLTYDAIDER